MNGEFAGLIMATIMLVVCGIAWVINEIIETIKKWRGKRK